MKKRLVSLLLIALLSLTLTVGAFAEPAEDAVDEEVQQMEVVSDDGETAADEADEAEEAGEAETGDEETAELTDEQLEAQQKSESKSRVTYLIVGGVCVLAILALYLVAAKKAKK